jgi:hypothetical protein
MAGKSGRCARYEQNADEPQAETAAGMKTAPHRHRHHYVYLVAVSLIGVVFAAPGFRNLQSYLLGGNELPLVFPGPVQRFRGVRHFRDDVARHHHVRLRPQERPWLPGCGPVQSDLPDDFSVGVVAAVERDHRGAMDRHALRRWHGGADSHTIVVLFAIIGCLGFMVYGFVGLGKFMEVFNPWESVKAYVPFSEHIAARYVPHLYGIVFTLAAVIYTVLGGMTSIVLADILQYLIITVSAVFVAGIAMWHLSGQQLAVPDGWMNPFFGWHLNLDWSGIIAEAAAKIQEDQFSLFTVIMMLMLFKGSWPRTRGRRPTMTCRRSWPRAIPRGGLMSVCFDRAVAGAYLMVAGFAVLGLCTTTSWICVSRGGSTSRSSAGHDEPVRAGA